MSNLDGLHDDDKYPRTSFQAFLEQTQIPKEFKRLNLKKLNGLEKFVRDNEVSPFIELISRQEAHSLSIWKPYYAGSSVLRIRVPPLADVQINPYMSPTQIFARRLWMYAFEHSEQGVLSVRTKGSVYSDASVGEDFEADRARSGRSQEDLVAEERVRGLWNDLPYEGFLEAMRIEALQLIRECLEMVPQFVITTTQEKPCISIGQLAELIGWDEAHTDHGDMSFREIFDGSGLGKFLRSTCSPFIRILTEEDYSDDGLIRMKTQVPVYSNLTSNVTIDAPTELPVDSSKQIEAAQQESDSDSEFEIQSVLTDISQTCEEIRLTLPGTKSAQIKYGCVANMCLQSFAKWTECLEHMNECQLAQNELKMSIKSMPSSTRKSIGLLQMCRSKVSSTNPVHHAAMDAFQSPSVVSNAIGSIKSENFDLRSVDDSLFDQRVNSCHSIVSRNSCSELPAATDPAISETSYLHITDERHFITRENSNVSVNSFFDFPPAASETEKIYVAKIHKLRSELKSILSLPLFGTFKKRETPSFKAFEWLGDSYLHYELTKLLRSEVIIGSTAFVEDYEQKLSATPKGLSINAALDKARQNSENNATLALLFDELHLVEVCPDAVLTKVGFFKSKADTLEAIIGELNDFVVKGEGEVMLLERVSAALLSLVRACFERGRILLSSQRIEELLVEAYRPGGRGFARSRTDLNAMASFLFRG